jgi:signal transduction histidine kinase
MIYVQLRESDKAIEYFSQAMQLAQKTDDLYMQGAIHHGLTQVYLDFDRFDDALQAGLQAVAIGEQLGNAVAHAYAHYKLAAVYIHAEDYDLAQKSLETALSLVGPDRIVDRLRFNIGLAYLEMLIGEAASARDRFLDLLPEIQNKGNIRMVVKLHEYLVNAHKLLGDYEAALHHSEAFQKATTALFNQERDRRLSILEVVYRTEQAQTELEAERLRREQDRLYYENLSKMRDEFITSATHDLKSPLSSMAMMLYMLEDLVDNDPKAREYITRLSRSLESMRTLITDLLDLASLETLHAVELKGVEMSSFVAKVVEDHKIVAQSKSTALSFISNATDVTVCCDQNQMRRVIDNLVSNAIKYTPVGGDIFVVLELKKDAFHIHVKDNGYGIPADELPHIFDRFYRVKNSNHAEETGTGLGLAIAKAIIERHSGTISVESQLNQGTTFSIVIPVQADSD